MVSGSQVAQNAVENNYLTAVQWVSIEAEFLRCSHP
ncbi:VENN motif pre-toxin domain-containing protein [Paralysiella testudinis]